MKKIKLSLVFVLGVFCICASLQAELQFSIADTLAVGGMSFGNVIQLNSTHYVSVSDYRVSLYQVQNESVTLLDQEISTVYWGYSPYHQISGNRLYVLSSLKGIMVFEVSDTALSFVGEISLNDIPGRDRQNMFMKIFGTTLVTGYLYTPPGSANVSGYYDVYDISDISDPSLMASFDLPGTSNIINNVLFSGGVYYIFTSKGDVYSTPNLSQLSFIDILPVLPDDEMIMKSFVRDNTLFLVTQGPFGVSLVKCNQQAGNQLGIAWMISLPFWYCNSIWQVDNRVIFSGYVGSENKLFAYTPSENIWTLEFQRNLNIGALFQIPEGYLAFSSSSVNQYDQSLNQNQVFYQGEVYFLDKLLAGRYAIMRKNQNSTFFKIYDIQNRSWLDYSSTRQAYIPKRSIATNQVIFYSNADCELLTFNEDGSYLLSSFSFPDNPLSLDVWGNRVLASYSGVQKTISVYELSGNTLSQIRTATTSVYYANTCFYDADHLVDSGYSDAYAGFELDFYRINNGNLQLLAQYPIPNSGSPYVTSDRLTLGVLDSPIFDLSDPESPHQESLFALPILGGSELSFDGQDRYLIGPDNNQRYYLAHADFTNLTTFRASNLVCLARNKMLASDSNLLIVLEHPEPVDSDDPTLPEIASLQGSVYPNPFRTGLSLELLIKENAPTKVEVYNLKGQKLKTLFSGLAKTGTQSFPWDARDKNGRSVAAGIYLLKVKSGLKERTFKTIYLKP